MKKIKLFFSAFTLMVIQAYSQEIPQHNFSFNGTCSMEKTLSTKDDKGNDVIVYQCINQNGEIVDVFRVIIIEFNYTISEKDTYIESLKKEYSALGATKEVSFQNHRAVQYDETVSIEGHLLKQRSTTILYKNRSYAFTLVSNSGYFDALNSKFLQQIKLK